MSALASKRSFLTDLFKAAVLEADPMRGLGAHLPPRPKGRMIVIGAGKASARMAEAAEMHYGPCEGLVITRYGHSRPCKGIEITEAAHPVPDAACVMATARMLDLISGLGPDDLVLALISGGGSSLLCAPAPGMSLVDKQAVNSALLQSGAPIGEMNILRKHLSRVKGGQLAAAAYPARVLALMISDVPGDDPRDIASGPTVAEESTAADALALCAKYALDLPPSVMRVLREGSGVIPVGDRRLSRCENRIIAAPAQSLNAAADMARAHGVNVRILGDSLEGEARDLGQSHARMARQLQDGIKEPLLLLSGGECTVTRRGNGVGGPNAEYVLACALALDGAAGIHVLSCDTDGVDGAAEVAGAYAGPDLLAHAREQGLDPVQALAQNDAHGFFGMAGGQIVTGPTLTNVNDFRAILILPTEGD